MSVEKVDTLVVGGGQAGVAMSEHLSSAACRISSSSGTALPNAGARKDGTPWLPTARPGTTGFRAWSFPIPIPMPSSPKEKVADYFVAYAEKIAAPIRCGVEVTKVQRNVGRPGFRVETSDGVIEANNVVAATGAFPAPRHPGHRSRRCRAHADPFQRLPQSRPAARGRGAGGRCGVLGGADRGRTPACGKARLPLGRPARSSAPRLSRARLLLVAGGSRQVGCRRRRGPARSMSRSR